MSHKRSGLEGEQHPCNFNKEGSLQNTATFSISRQRWRTVGHTNKEESMHSPPHKAMSPVYIYTITPPRQGSQPSAGKWVWLQKGFFLCFSCLRPFFLRANLWAMKNHQVVGLLSALLMRSFSPKGTLK